MTIAEVGGRGGEREGELSRCVNGCNYDNQSPAGRGGKCEDQFRAVEVSHQVQLNIKHGAGLQVEHFV